MKSNKANQFNRWKCYLKAVAPRNALIYMEDQGIKAKFFLRIGNIRTPVFRVHILSKPKADYLQFCNWISRRQGRVIGKHFQFNRFTKYGKWENPRRRQIKKAMKPKGMPHAEAIRKRHEYHWSNCQSAWEMYGALHACSIGKHPAEYSYVFEFSTSFIFFPNAVMMYLWDIVAIKHGGKLRKSFIVHACGPYALRAIHDPTEKDIYNWSIVLIDSSAETHDETFFAGSNEETTLAYMRKLVRYFKQFEYRVKPPNNHWK